MTSREKRVSCCFFVITTLIEIPVFKANSTESGNLHVFLYIILFKEDSWFNLFMPSTLLPDNFGQVLFQEKEYLVGF